MAVIGPIDTSMPSLPNGLIANAAPPGPFFQDFKPPYPTTGWTDDSNGLASLDTQSVTVKYFAASGVGYTTYLVPGSPYMTFNYNSATILLTSMNGNIASVNGINVGTSSGTKFTVVNDAGTHTIYSLGGSISLTATTTTLTGEAAFTGVIRIARVTEESTSQAVLDQYSANYPTSVALDYTFSGDSATLSFTWNVVGNAAQLLHLSWPHHRKRLVNPTYITGLSYLTTKGYMKPVLGNTWTLSYALPTITWQAPRTPQASCTQQIIQALEYEVANLAVAVPGDFYYWGKAFQAAARLALIADHMGRQDLIPTVINVLKESFAYWTESGQSTYAAYETAWGGIVDGAGATDPNIDFGNGYATVIAKYDTAWWSANKQFVSYFARDIGNPSNADPYFTVARCKDCVWSSERRRITRPRVHRGSDKWILRPHSFANILGNQDLINWARLLWATEVDGAQTYWHLYPNANDPDTPYLEAGLRSLTTIGNVMDYQAGAWLNKSYRFWGAQRSEIAAIQILPVTPINEGLYDTAWLTSVWPYVANELVDPTIGDEWKAVIYMAYGEVDPETAFSRSTNITAWGGTTSQALLLYHLSTPQNPAGPSSSARHQDNSSPRATPHPSWLILNGWYPVRLHYMPGGGSILNTVTSQYVTADPNAAVPLAAARTVAQAWESFQVVLQTDGTYVMRAGANSEYIILDPTGALYNNGTALGLQPNLHS
ncbi:glycosyl hydrolase family 81-domain-containing protein [Mycena sp. CBHHK59/15]|nr:glycosyl hydrolase family 81-domain-containing protein [Mycena sp. CBHHK59/15]